MSDRGRATAVVLGDVDLVRPLALAAIPCAAYAPPHDPVRWSRHVRARLPYRDPWLAPEALVDAVLDFAGREREPPVLLPQGDGELLALSRHRERLAPACRQLLAPAELVEELVDKGRFLALAERCGLPVPPAVRVVPAAASPADVDLAFPVVVKPLVRRADRWRAVEAAAKAVHVADRAGLERLWPRLAAAGDLEVLAQEAVPGDERRIESFHAYVGADGEVVAEFTGRKLRTSPARYGHSTALQLTDAADVAAAGREAFGRLGLVGVAKADFKRGPDGTLHLLEVNPRFTLWHHLAAVAGLNVPALVHADLTGAPRGPVGRARPGATWCIPLSDLLAVVRTGGSVRAWLGFLARCDARSGLALDDPLPFFPGAVLRAGLRRVQDAAGRR